ncbi:MAG: cupin domain-containing protein [Candidatus Bathyarchaeia archaeon]
MSAIDAYIRDWRQALPTESHGALIERRIFSKVDPANPSKPGAVMQNVKSFSRAVLEGYVATTPTAHEGEQEILYVADGEGRIESQGITEKLSEGSAVLVPPGVSHVIVNETRNPLELLVLTEDVPPESMSKVGERVVVRNYHTLPVSVGGHWCHVVRGLFGSNDGLVTLHSVLVVSIDGMNIGEPHAHGPGTDEVWYQLKGTSLLFLGREIRRQHPGEAFMVPPDGQTPHSSINDTDEPMQWFYFAHYGR